MALSKLKSEWWVSPSVSDLLQIKIWNLTKLLTNKKGQIFVCTVTPLYEHKEYGEMEVI